MIREVDWTTFKNFVEQRELSIQWIDINGHYYLSAIDGPFAIECSLYKADSDQTAVEDFEDNFKSLGNKSPKSEVKTQFERDDLTIKMAKVKATVVNGTARIELLVPGEAGVDTGRFIAGGYGILDTYDPDDYIECTIEDVDRIIAWQVALAIDPQAEAPVSDETVQGLGTYLNYPVVGSYTDDEVPAANQGWYFWPCARGNGASAIGEVELEPLGFYGLVPSGFYLVFTVTRPNVSGGVVRGDIIWGKKEI